MSYISKIITSAHNDEIKQLARLAQNPRERRKQQLMLLEGIHLTESCLEAGIVPERVYLNEAAQAHAEVGALLRRLYAPTTVVMVPEAVLAKATALASAGELLALCPRPQPRPSRRRAAGNAGGHPGPGQSRHHSALRRGGRGPRGDVVQGLRRCLFPRCYAPAWARTSR